MKKKTGIIISVIVAIIIAMIGGGVAVSGVLDPYEKQIKLGYKMIDEGKYDEAILAFNEAIEINEKKPKAYVGLKDTYVTRCDDNTVDDASEILQRGYEKSKSKEIIQAYIDAGQTIFDKDKKEWAVKLLENGYEVTSSEDIKSKLNELKERIKRAFLENIYELCKKDSLDEVRKIMDSDEFKKIVAAEKEKNPIMYLPENSDKNNETDNNSNDKSVKQLGIYSTDKEVYIYYGDYNNNVRSGEGIWLGEYYLYRGQWSNDKPNGSGVSYEGESEKEACRITGNVIDGFWNETINHTDVHDGKEELYEIVQYDNGKILSVQYEEGGEVLSREQVIENNDENEKRIEPHGILGFAKFGWS